MIGPNGVGKTTCFNLLSKFLNPTRGRIVFDGRDITALATRLMRPSSGWCVRSRSPRCFRT